MKFCDYPWTFWYLINAEKGGIWSCSWLDENWNIGNILEQDIDDILQSDTLRKLRESILDGSFRYCDTHKCTYLANNLLPDLTMEEIAKITSQKYPSKFNLSYDETCNHACPSCRKKFFMGSREYYEKVELITNKMMPYFNRAEELSVDGRGEVFAAEHMLRILEKLEPERKNFKLYIETNGSLLDDKHWSRIKHLERYNIVATVTVNSFHDSTYRYLNGYSNHVEQVIRNLHYIKQLRKKNAINKLTIAMVVQEANFRELPEYVERCITEFGADEVELRGIMKFTIDEDEFWFKDVFNPAHPCYREVVDILHQPIMQDERVWSWEGDYEHVRTPMRQPSKRFEDYYNILWRLLQIEEKGELSRIFLPLKGKKVALYGAGHITEILMPKMKKHEVNITCIYDSYKGGYDIFEIPVICSNSICELNDVELILNTVTLYEEDVKKWAHQMGAEFLSLNELVLGT